MIRRSPIDFSITAGACIQGCLLLLLLPADLIVAFSVAVLIHECSHILVLYFLRIPILRIELRTGGAVIRSAQLSVTEELICAAAGPAGSFLCLLLLRRFPLLALCGCLQGVYNLLPVYPLDGGRILRCFCLWLCPQHADLICKTVKSCVITGIIIISLFLSIRIKDIVYLLPAVYFLLQTGMQRKFPCKQRSF